MNTVSAAVLSGPVGACVPVAIVLWFSLHCFVKGFALDEPLQATSGPACTAPCTCVKNL
jgi:hypothetical protein